VATGIDHVVILVDDLQQGIEQFERLGFRVTPGGKHARFTHNALVPFADGSYLELIAFYEHPQEGSAETHRWYRHVGTGLGIIDYAIGATNLDTLVADADTRGVQLGGPHEGYRARPDNVELRWKSVMPEGDNVGALPFVIEDVTDRNLRVPQDATDHPNSVRGIHAITIAVRDLDAAVKRYCTLLEREMPSGDTLPNIDDADGVYFLIGGHRIDLATPRSQSSELGRHLATYGDSPYELALLARDTIDIDPARAANARIRLVAG
jgi:catechol 2,3-dioxygenase-like lactoylglutathione lyase family enzyme